MNELLKRLKEDVEYREQSAKESQEYNEYYVPNFDSRGWGSEEGILISVNEAKQVLQILEQPNRTLTTDDIWNNPVVESNLDYIFSKYCNIKDDKGEKGISRLMFSPAGKSILYLFMVLIKGKELRTQKYTSIEYINKVQELIDKFICGEKSEIGLKNGLLDLLIDVRDIELQEARKDERKELLKKIAAIIYDLEYVQGDLGKILEVPDLLIEIEKLQKE